MKKLKNLSRMAVSLAAIPAIAAGLYFSNTGRVSAEQPQTTVTVQKAFGDNNRGSVGIEHISGTPESKMVTLRAGYENRSLNYSAGNTAIDRTLGIASLSAELYRKYGLQPGGDFKTLTLGYRLVGVDTESDLTEGSLSRRIASDGIAHILQIKPGVKARSGNSWNFYELNLMRVAGERPALEDVAGYELSRDLETDSWVYGASINRNDNLILGFNRINRDNREDGTSVVLTLLDNNGNYKKKFTVAYTDNVNRRGVQWEFVGIRETPEAFLLGRITDDNELRLEAWNKKTGIGIIGERERYNGEANNSIYAGKRFSF